MSANSRVMDATFHQPIPALQKQTSVLSEPIAFNFTNVLAGILVILLLISALGVVYVKDLDRRLFIQYQNLQQARSQALIDWGKLLLEESTWSVQSRIQLLAQQNLNMKVPLATEIVLVPTLSHPLASEVVGAVMAAAPANTDSSG